MAENLRVRFAPSPTGPLHIGGVRTALFNYLFARQSGGSFVLRIEDTDQTRTVPGAENYILEALDWVGISPDESIRDGGDYGPYRQSERKAIYRDYAFELVEKGYAYYAFDTSEDLEAMRERLKAAKVVNPQYNAISRDTMKNSLTLPQDEVKARLDAGEPYVIRLKIPRKEDIRLNDLIRGWVMVHAHTLDDKILLKSDGMPTYHLANVVDDHLMDITHVIRGEEWLPSAPTHVLLYRYLGWEKQMPRFAHLPLIMKPSGEGKLSKRDGKKFGFPVFPLEWNDPQEEETFMGFREFGFLPGAAQNFLALLGWSPGDNTEFFTPEQLLERFELGRMGKSGTKFDIDKAKWINQQHLRQRPMPELIGMLEHEAQKAGLDVSAYDLEKVVDLVKERAIFRQDLFNEARSLFGKPQHYDEKTVEKKWTPEAADALREFAERLAGQEPAQGEAMKSLMAGIAEEKGLKLGKVMPPLRLALTGEGKGPDLTAIMEILGPREIKARIEKALDALGEKA